MKFLFKLLFGSIYKVFAFCFLFAVGMATGLGLYATSLLPDLPTVEEIRQIPLNVPLRIYSSDEKLIAEYGNERRIPVTLDQAPSLLIDAILVTEDDQFYHHTGVDFPGIIRAAISNIRSQSRGQGASTVTMQVVRNFFLNPEKTYTRKLKEILLAFNMERALTKDEILELYLNKIFLGHRSYGFAAAAQVYYGQDLQDLSVPEIAMLAGLPKAPSRDNPISNPKRAEQRRDYVLKRLHELGKIDDLSLKTAQEAPITADRHVADVDFPAPFVAEMARQALFDVMGEAVYESGLNVTVTIDSEMQGYADEALRKGIFDYDVRHGYRGPIKNLEIDAMDELAIDDALLEIPPSRELQPAVVLEVAGDSFSALIHNGQTVTVSFESMKWAQPYLSANSKGPEPTKPADVVKRGDFIYLKEQPAAEDEESSSWTFSQLPDVSGALVSLDSESGAILALAGGFDYYLSKFNRAVQAERQPGSNIKPFIYSAALDHGFTPASFVSAAPIVVEDDLEGVWRPQNYSKKFFGPTRLRKALSLSLNLVSVRLLRAMGISTTVEHLEKFGFESEKLPQSLSLALGSTLITPLELAAGYAVLANGGLHVEPFLIEKIEDADGNLYTLEDLAPNAEEETEEQEEVAENLETDQEQEDIPEELRHGDRAISEQNAFLTQSIMQQVILSGTGRRALALNRSDLAGKTGTTNDFKDAWFSGFNPDVTTTVYIGFDEPEHLGRRESGASAALPVWVDFMGNALKKYPEQELVIPENIVSRFIDQDSGEITSPENPDGYTEYFLEGTEPQGVLVNTSPSAEQAPAPAVDSKSVSENLF